MSPVALASRAALPVRRPQHCLCLFRVLGVLRSGLGRLGWEWSVDADDRAVFMCFVIDFGLCLLEIVLKVLRFG